MIQNPVDGRRGPNAIVSFVVAALFLALALWTAVTGDAWAIGLAVVAALWLIIGVRAFKRERPRR